MSDDKEAQYAHVLHAIFKDYSRLEPTLPSESFNLFSYCTRETGIKADLLCSLSISLTDLISHQVLTLNYKTVTFMSVRNKTPHPEESFLPAGCFLHVYVFAGTWSFRFLRSITVKMTANVNSNMLMICDVERPNRKPRISSPLKNSSMNLMTGYV